MSKHICSLTVIDSQEALCYLDGLVPRSGDDLSVVSREGD